MNSIQLILNFILLIVSIVLIYLGGRVVSGGLMYVSEPYGNKNIMERDYEMILIGLCIMATGISLTLYVAKLL